MVASRGWRDRPTGADFMAIAMTVLDSLESSRTFANEGFVLLQLGLACLLGGVIGFEREIRDRAAGLRTHMLIALAAALFTIIMAEITRDYARAGNVNMDPVRIVEAVTSGVAFLAAGAIIHGRGEVRGLTTGAGMWMAGAIGVACGSGYFVIAAMATALSTVILAGLKYLERRIMSHEASATSDHRTAATKPMPADPRDSPD
jgi:putative Mg2+ transporter-C (MgtC) family protein